MGIGLMFYGVAEPLAHFADPPAAGIEPGSTQAARSSMSYTLFHWTLHPWAIYAVVGLAIAYGSYRKGRGGLISSAFAPLLGDRAQRGPGKAIDVFAILATLFGSATSLGLGALQINGGLTDVLGLPDSRGVQIAIIAVLTALFIASAVSGVGRGIKWLSNANMGLAGVLLVFLFVAGPTIFILNLVPASVGGYLSTLVPMSLRTGAFGGTNWLSAWTIFYWAWWISWTPFVGAFIARISRGRTIREFVIGVVLVPSVVSVVWFAVLGGSALHLAQDGSGGLTKAAAESPENALFAMLDAFPLAGVTSVLVVVLVAVFFVSGADAASVVLGSLSSRGSESPSRRLVVTWGTLTGLVGAVLLVAGGLEALQTLTIAAALPFTVITVGLCWSLVTELRTDPAARTAPARERHIRRDDLRRRRESRASAAVAD
jgi:choline/carnitine/betaine transport